MSSNFMSAGYQPTPKSNVDAAAPPTRQHPPGLNGSYNARINDEARALWQNAFLEYHKIPIALRPEVNDPYSLPRLLTANEYANVAAHQYIERWKK